MKMTERVTAFVAVCVLAAGFFSRKAEPEYIDKTPAPDKTPPAEVTQLQAAAGDGKISLSWKNPADADLYQVEISAEPADGTLKNPVYLAAAKDAAASFIAEGLKNGTAYAFAVRTIDKALNKSKGVKSENAVQPVDSSDKTPPAEVTQLQTTAGDGKISLSWKNPADADLYQVEISAEPADGTLKNPVYLAAAKDTAGSFIAEGLKNGTAYAFTVRTIDKALNKSNGVKSESAVQPVDSSDKTPPAEVTQLQAAAGDGKISLSWKNPADTDLYQVELSAEPADGTLKNPVYLAAAKDAAGSFIAAGLKNGTAYTFTVRTLDKSNGVKSAVQHTLAGGSVMSITLVQNPAKEIKTHEDVTITVSSSTTVQEAKWMRGAKSAKEVWANGAAITGGQFTVGTNGLYSVAVRDNAGRREVETIEIKNIDKTPPAAVSNVTAAYKSAEQKIVVKWRDPADESGIKEIKIAYAAGSAPEQRATVAGGIQQFEIPGVTVQNPPVQYRFMLKPVDNAGNEGAEQSIRVTPSEQAEVTNITVSRKKIAENDPDKTVTVTLTGSRLTQADEIKITGKGTVLCTITNDSTASAAFTLPDERKRYTFRVSIKQHGAATAVPVAAIEAKTEVCASPDIDRMSVTKADGSEFGKDAYGALKAAAGDVMTVTLYGSNLDVDGFAAGVRFTGSDFDGTANADGTSVTVANIAIPPQPGTYSIQAQQKALHETAYSARDRIKKLVRILGDIKLTALYLPGYAPDREGTEDTLTILGENFDTLSADMLSSIQSALGGTVSGAEVKDSVTIEARYTIPDLSDDSIIGKTETLTLAGKTVSSALHTLKIRKEDDGTYAVTGYYVIPSNGNAHIPAWVGQIDSYAFKNCAEITSVSFPASVTAIGEEAFSGCAKLQGADLSACTKLTAIGYRTFYECKALTGVSLPAGITTIGTQAFESCKKLQGADLSACTKLTTIKNNAFSACLALTSVSIPASVTDIGQSAFSGCYKLQEANLSACTKLTTIENNVFSYCLALTSVSLPASVTTIGREAFRGCEKLLQANLAACTKLTTIDKQAFYNCKALTGVSIPENVTAIGQEAFSGCKAIIGANFPASLTSIRGYAFSGCEKLQGAELSTCTRLMEIRDNAFSGCKALTSVSFPASITTIESAAFSKCKKLQRADLSVCTKLTKIKDGTFENCKALTGVNFPAGIKTIGGHAFSDCEKLQGADLSTCKKLTLIEGFAFSNCKALTDENIPANVTSIENGVFSSCTALTNVSFPTGITTIEQWAFYECKALTGVSIPASVTSIGENAFYGCGALTSVTMKCKYNSEFGKNIFTRCYSLGSGSIKVPADQLGTYKSHASDLGVERYCFAPLQP